MVQEITEFSENVSDEKLETDLEKYLVLAL